MFKTVSAALGRTATRRSRQPVRRDSYPLGQCEARFWRPMPRQDTRRILLAARLYDKNGRQRGQPKGPLGHVALDVLALMVNLMDPRTGRLEPSYAFLAKTLNRSRGAVAEALAALREHGFLDRLRRVVAVEREGPGPRVRQASNAYRLKMPSRAAKLLGWFAGSPSLPDDVVQAQAERAAELEAHKAALSLEELGRFSVEDDALGRALGQLGQWLQSRESTAQPEC